MNKKTMFVAGVAGLMGAAIAVGVGANAYRGDSAQKGPNYTPERHEAMEQVFENNNYSAWKDLMQDRGRVTQVVTEQNFARFSEMHNLMEEGKNDEANAIRTELGLGLKNGSGQGNGAGRGIHGDRGQNKGGSFVDANGDGVCDRMK